MFGLLVACLFPPPAHCSALRPSVTIDFSPGPRLGGGAGWRQPARRDAGRAWLPAGCCVSALGDPGDALAPASRVGRRRRAGRRRKRMRWPSSASGSGFPAAADRGAVRLGRSVAAANATRHQVSKPSTTYFPRPQLPAERTAGQGDRAVPAHRRTGQGNLRNPDRARTCSGAAARSTARSACTRLVERRDLSDPQQVSRSCLRWARTT